MTTRCMPLPRCRTSANKFDSYAHVNHCALSGSPYLCGIERGLPRVFCTHNGMGNAIVGQVFAAKIDAEVPKLSRNLGLELAVGRVIRVVIQLSFAVELSCYIKLPQGGGGLVRQGEQSLVQRGEWTLPQLTVIGGRAVGSRHAAAGCPRAGR